MIAVENYHVKSVEGIFILFVFARLMLNALQQTQVEGKVLTPISTGIADGIS